MKKKSIVYFSMLILSLCSVLFVNTSRAEDGKWEDVCCGSTCFEGDYCLGKGTYKCCK